MVTSCKKGVIEDKQVKQLETHLISERKSSGPSLTSIQMPQCKQVGHWVIMTLKKKGGNWVKGNDKKGGSFRT